MDSALFDQSYWLGGSSCCGKSTVAAQLSSRFGLRHVKQSDGDRRYDDRVSPVDHPAATRFLEHKRKLLEGKATIIDEPFPVATMMEALPSVDVIRQQLRERDSVARWAPSVEPEEALERLTELFYEYSESFARLAHAHDGAVIRCETVEERAGLADRVASTLSLR